MNNYQTIIEIFEEQTKKSPQALAVSDSFHEMTYTRLNDYANSLARFFDQHVSTAKPVICIFLERHIELIAAVLATFKINGSYLLIDPNYPKERATYCINESNPALIITQKKYKEKLLSLKLPETNILFIDDCQIMSQSDYFAANRNTHDLAYAMFTSGTTGKPKGIMIEQHSLVNIILDFKYRLNLGQNDRFLSVTSQSFDIFALEIFLPLLCGAHCILYQRDETLDIEDLKHVMKKTNPTIMQATPSLWSMLVNIELPEIPSMQVLCGGERLTPNLAKALIGKYEKVYNVYGPTETTIWSTIHHVTNPEEIILGLPISNTTCYVYQNNFEPVTISETGELYIGGAGLARGYLNNDELTKECFIHHPKTKERLYKTGDLVRLLSAGKLSYVGRVDHQIKINGHRIEIEEIENILLALSFIKQVCIVTHHSDNEIFLFYTFDEQLTDENTINKKINNILTKWLPKSVIPSKFYPIKEFPLNSNGKIDRNLLKQFIATPNKENTKPVSIEETILNIWQETLKQNNLDKNTHFVNLGGNSIHIPQIISKINRLLNTRLTIRNFMENQTINQLTKFVADKCSLIA